MAEYRELLLAKDIAKSWHVAPAYVRELAQKGLLLGLRFKSETRYMPEEVLAFEEWAKGKDISDPDNITDLRTGELVPHRFAEQAKILKIGG